MTPTSIITKQELQVHYRPGTADEHVLAESFENDIFFSRLPEYKPTANHNILDIGAHIGCFSLLAAQLVPQGKVYSFEPSAESYAVLEKNIRANHCNNIRAFQLAMAAKNGTAILYHDIATGNWGHSITKELSGETEQVECITLEHFLQSENIEQVDLIKFNCEGAEFGILCNTSPAILKRIKCMLILYHGFLEKDISKNQLASHLSHAGFHIHYRYQNKDDDSGWMIAYRAGFFENMMINLRTCPLTFSIFRKKLLQKLKRI